MLMTTPYLEQTVREYVRPNALPIGIHLSLTLGRAIAPPNQVPGLIDQSGNLKLSAKRLIFSSFRTNDTLLLKEIRSEFEAQLALAHDCGLRPTHADSHQHVHMNPAIFAIVEDILPRYGIARIRYSRERFVLAALGRDLPTTVQGANAAKWLVLRWRSSQIKPSLTTNDEFFGILHSGVLSKTALRLAIAKSAPDASTEICLHPGFPAGKSDASYRQLNYNKFISSTARQIEHDILVDEEMATLVRRRGLVLRSFDGHIK
jgi:predicted glycoside hydrolase/deacetylase ChbG (UPF0249 family)